MAWFKPQLFLILLLLPLAGFSQSKILSVNFDVSGAPDFSARVVVSSENEVQFYKSELYHPEKLPFIPITEKSKSVEIETDDNFSFLITGIDQIDFDTLDFQPFQLLSTIADKIPRGYPCPVVARQKKDCPEIIQTTFNGFPVNARLNYEAEQYEIDLWEYSYNYSNPRYLKFKLAEDFPGCVSFQVEYFGKKEIEFFPPGGCIDTFAYMTFPNHPGQKNKTFRLDLLPLPVKQISILGGGYFDIHLKNLPQIADSLRIDLVTMVPEMPEKTPEGATCGNYVRRKKDCPRKIPILLNHQEAKLRLSYEDFCYED